MTSEYIVMQYNINGFERPKRHRPPPFTDNQKKRYNYPYILAKSIFSLTVIAACIKLAVIPYLLPSSSISSIQFFAYPFLDKYWCDRAVISLEAYAGVLSTKNTGANYNKKEVNILGAVNQKVKRENNESRQARINEKESMIAGEILSPNQLRPGKGILIKILQ